MAGQGKRPLEENIKDNQSQTSTQRKRAKMRQQREIPVEGKHHRAGGSAAHGNSGLPPTIEVDKFVQVRSFEISAMQRSMKAAKDAGTQRAFQSLARHLRRRAASHNIRRLPTRLRKRALFEVPKDAAKPKRKTRSILHGKRKVTGLDRYMQLRRRQVSKIWLETHIWHAKRMHMTEIWGHRLADRPTAKAFRSSYRASKHGALVHDASYYQYLQLRGREAHLAQVFGRVCDPTSPLPSSARYTSGVREWTGSLYNEGQFPRGLIGPASIVWQAKSDTARGRPAARQEVSARPGATCLVRLHPAMAKRARSAFASAIKDVNTRVKDGSTVEIKTFDQQLLTFEITGDRASEVVKSVLMPVRLNPASEEAWSRLNPVTGPGAVPSGMVFGLHCADPRLSFPPVLSKQKSRVDETPCLPTPSVAESPRFWSGLHKGWKLPKFTKRQLDERRSENLVPGTRLTLTTEDDIVPVLLIQRTLGSASGGDAAGSSSTSDHSLAGWTLIVPVGWGMPFFASLAYANTRVGGQRERAQQSYEAGEPHFPNDFPCTRAFTEHEVRRESEDKGYWDRRPRAKRPNYEKLGTVWPWRCEMGSIVRQLRSRAVDATAETAADRAESDLWLLSGNVARQVITVVTGNSSGTRIAGTQNHGNPATRKLVQDLIESRTADFDASGHPGAGHYGTALVRVRVDPCARGKIDSLALLYSPTEAQLAEIRPKVKAMLVAPSHRPAKTTAERDEEPLQLCAIPKRDQIVGRTTTGGFSLSRGRGFAIGVIPLSVLVDLAQADERAIATGQELGREERNLVLVRNRDGEVYRAASVSVL